MQIRVALLFVVMLAAKTYTQWIQPICGRAPLAPTTGRREVNEADIVENKIIGGSVATPNAWPWHGTLLEQNFFICGASLIDSAWALTAARCINTYVNKLP